MPEASLSKIIGALVGAVLIVILALENQHPVQVHLFFWALPRVSLALLMLLCVLFGAVLGILALLWDRQKRRGVAARQPMVGVGHDADAALSPPSDDTVNPSPPSES